MNIYQKNSKSPEVHRYRSRAEELQHQQRYRARPSHGRNVGLCVGEKSARNWEIIFSQSLIEELVFFVLL